MVEAALVGMAASSLGAEATRFPWQPKRRDLSDSRSDAISVTAEAMRFPWQPKRRDFRGRRSDAI